MGWCVESGCGILVYCSEKETDAVKLAAENFRTDLKRVLEAESAIKTDDPEGCRIVLHTMGTETGFGEWEKLLPSEAGRVRKEAYLRTVKNGILYIIGADRRGTVYGIYDFCRWMGVSPWHFWADVPVRARKRLELEEGSLLSDYPSVEYRGVFLNDEEELEKWVRLHMGEETIGVKTYEKIFELLLRLKGNYIWPAMHVNSFNSKPENGALADRMGVVVGTSHCDMLMRSNNREWLPWLAAKGYQDVEYDYSIPGRNREILNEYWRESVRQNKDFEVSYTLGMRGIHDSGFETHSLRGLEGKELLDEKIRLLETVIRAQQEILKETLDREPMKTFVPYKEVLELYNNGLEVPEELTLIWANDNYGYIRRYPNEKERRRKGGNGIYYHNSYWSPPGASYLFINSIPLAHTRNELYKAWREGIRKLWVMNVGALKPLEQEIEYYLRLGWEIGKEDAITEDVDAYLEQWINENFSGGHGREMACVLNEFAQLTNVRKIEQLDSDAFSQTAYGDEASGRIFRYRELVRRAEAVYRDLPAEERDSFFQLCLLKLHAAYITNCMYYYADRSNLCIKQGKNQAARIYTEYCREYEDARRRLLLYYGEELSGGKWEGIVTPEDFPPPRTAMLPACVPPLEAGEKGLLVDCWNDEEGLNFVKDTVKWIQLANAGEGELFFRLEAPEWLKLSETEGKVAAEKRILARAASVSGTAGAAHAQVQSGCIRVCCEETGQEIIVPAAVDFSHAAEENPEDGGMLSVPADTARELAGMKRQMEESGQARALAGNGWKLIPRLGRSGGSLVEACEKGAPLTYSFYVTHSGAFLLELYRFPSLNATGRIRVQVSVDGGERKLLETESVDEWRGTWKINVRDNVDRLYLRLPTVKAGRHTLTLWSVDPYFALSQWTLYTCERKAAMLGGAQGKAELPEYEAPSERFCYGKLPLGSRPVFYAPLEHPGDALYDTGVRIDVKEWGRKTTPEDILEEGRHIFEEKKGAISIDAAAALAETEYAYTEYRCLEHGRWEYCSSESYDRTGLAMYIREQGLVFGQNPPALNYRIRCLGGSYRVWVYLRCNPAGDSRLTLGVDDKTAPLKDIYGEGRIWCYAAEQIYRWFPLWTVELEAGEHLLHIYTYASGTRFDRIYMTKGEELPPLDADWGSAI